MSSTEIDSFLAQPFTHIIVGGGTAGLVVAARLSENASLTVGVLEAGPAAFDEARINVPGRLGETLFSEYDWQFETTPQPGLNGRTLPWNRGKVLGGSSALNFMMWNRGNREDYDAWEALGNEGWGWEGMLPFFKKSESFHPPDQAYQEKYQAHFDPDFHGTTGPIHTIYPPESAECNKYWHATLNKLGIDTNRSHFSGSGRGCWTSLAAVDPESQQRSYSARAYYLPVSHRTNLFLLTEATVRNVILEREDEGEDNEWKATGVRFVHGGKEHTVTVEAKGEVILCAGTVSSPQLLELSGIGNPKILKAAGIEVKVANPNVGENLQEHMMSTMIYEINPSISTHEALRSDPILASAADDQYATSRTGPRTAVGYSAAYIPLSHFTTPEHLSRLAAQLPTPTSDPDSPSPPSRDQILAKRFTSTTTSPSRGIGQVEFLFDLGNYSPFFQSEPGKRYGTMMQMLQYPFSVGSIHIPAAPSPSKQPTTSADPPIIDPGYYAGVGGQVDFESMLSAQTFAHRICSTPPLSNIILRRVCPPLPSSSTEKTEDFTSFLRASTTTDWHPIGTCAMGGVVTPRLKVHGVKNLRVCDASVMPLMIGAHLQASVYAIGEKGAGMILEDWAGR